MVKKGFSAKSFLSIIEEAEKNNYVISSAKKARKYLEKKRPILILRHDIDFDLSLALKMARIENRLGVKSTYFILLYNDLYNPFSHEGKEAIREIKKLGHEIGIHWQSKDYLYENKKRLTRDIGLLSEICKEKVISGSMHQPVISSKMNVGKALKYEMYRDFKDFTYVSDSSMTWRKNTPWELIAEHKNIQFLAHPFWWLIGGKGVEEKFSSFYIQRREIDKLKISSYKNYTLAFLKKRKMLDAKYSK